MTAWLPAEQRVLATDPEHVWVFSFGFDHHDPQTGEPLDGCYVCIRGTFLAARERMVERFGTRWAFQYVDAEAAGVERYGLREVPFAWGLRP